MKKDTIIKEITNLLDFSTLENYEGISTNDFFIYYDMEKDPIRSASILKVLNNAKCDLIKHYIEDCIQLKIDIHFYNDMQQNELETLKDTIIKILDIHNNEISDEMKNVYTYEFSQMEKIYNDHKGAYNFYIKDPRPAYKYNKNERKQLLLNAIEKLLLKSGFTYDIYEDQIILTFENNTSFKTLTMIKYINNSWSIDHEYNLRSITNNFKVYIDIDKEYIDYIIAMKQHIKNLMFINNIKKFTLSEINELSKYFGLGSTFINNNKFELL